MNTAVNPIPIAIDPVLSLDTGHGNVEHASFSSDRPKQYKPAFSGGGLSQGLYRINSPPPHVVVHEDQSPHVPHFPFTAGHVV